MISFSKLGALGRLGNSLFQIASMVGIAKKLGTEAVFPRWKYERYFKFPFKNGQLPRMHKRKPVLYEPHFHYSDDWFLDERDYEGWLQSEKYFDDAKALFKFETGYFELVKAKYRSVLEKETICISVRRGDFIGNPNYEYLPAKYYIGALLKFDYKNCNLLFFSDDISYCKTHFECLENAAFISADPMEQICLMSMCSNHIISQSTFSWWGAYLSDSKRVIRPAYNFTEAYKAKGNDDKDYFPESWEKFDHKDYKIPLNISFLIPVQFDHQDREDNFNLAVKTLLQDFKCTIHIGENKTDRFKIWNDRKGIEYTQFYFEKFHRTKILNELSRRSDDDIVCVFDADVICPPMAIYLAVERIRDGVDMVYPYDGRFARVQRKWYSEILRYLDCGVLSRYQFEGTREYEMKSFGGAVLFNKERYFEGGAENENFISYAPEDFERFERFTRLGFTIERVRSVIYHIDHFIGIDSYIHHPDYSKNEIELKRVRSLTDEDLKNEFNNTVSQP